MQHFLEQSSEPTFVMQLAYLVDIFGHLDQLNLQLQGSGNEKFEGVGNIQYLYSRTNFVRFCVKLISGYPKLKRKTFNLSRL